MSAPLADTNVPVAEGDVLADKYKVERVLGQGAMGVVVAARHLQLQQRVAIKFLTGRATREVKGRFLREAQLAYKLRNEHVARVIDVGELEGGQPFMVMEYLSGQDLQQVLKALPPEESMPVHEAVGFVLQVCEAMAEAHSQGIVHRDLKPSNLFLTESSDGSKMVKVLDFGISKETSDPGESDGGMALTRTEAVLGSPLYMSIEQMRSSRDVDARADIYALGAILYQLLTKRVPYEAQTFPELILKVASEEPPPPSAIRPDLPPPLEQAILRCLKKDRAERFPNVGELAAAIAPFATDEGIGSAERALRTIDKSSGGAGSTTLSPAALRATRSSMGGARTGSSWSSSTTMGGGSKMKTVGIAAGALVLGAATVMGIIVATSRPSATASPTDTASTSTSAAPTSAPQPAQSSGAQPSITPLVVPAPYNDPSPSAKPSAKPTASATVSVAAPSVPGTPPPAQTQAPPPAQTQAPPPPATTPPPAATPAPTPTPKKNPLDIDIK